MPYKNKTTNGRMPKKVTKVTLSLDSQICRKTPFDPTFCQLRVTTTGVVTHFALLFSEYFFLA